MEKIPPFESPITERDQVVRALSEGGIDNPEARALLNTWLDAEQQKVSAGDMGALLAFNSNWADLARDAGLSEWALELYEQAATLADELGDEAQYARLMKEMEDLRSTQR